MPTECKALFTVSQKCFTSRCSHHKTCNLSKLCRDERPAFRPEVDVESTRGGIVILCDSFTFQDDKEPSEPI